MSMMPIQYHSYWFSVFFSRVHPSYNSLMMAIDSVNCSSSMVRVPSMFCSVFVYYLQVNVFLRNVDRNVVDECESSMDDYVDEDDYAPYSLNYLCLCYLSIVAVDLHR